MPEKTDTIKISHYLGLVFKHRWLLIIPFCIALVAGMYQAIKLPRIYEAKTLILVMPQRVPSEFVQSIVTADLDHPLLDDVPGLIDDIENGTESPDNIDHVVVLNDLPASFDPGTAYVINGNIHIDKEIQVEDVLIAVRGDISWGQKGAIVNATGACPSGEAAIGIIATGDVQLDQSARAEGIQLITCGNFDLDQNSVFSGSAAINGNAQIDQSPLISPCEDPFANPNSDGPRLVM